MANDAPDMELSFEDFEPAEVCSLAPEMTDLHGPRKATLVPSTPARGGSTALRYSLLGVNPLRWSWTVRTAMRMIAYARTRNRLKIVAA